LKTSFQEKVSLQTATGSSHPSENIWFLLRKTKEKIARMGDNSEFCPFLVELYNSARTHFITKT